MDLESRALDWCDAHGIESPPQSFVDWLVDMGDDTGWLGLDRSDYEGFCRDEEIQAQIDRHAA